MAPLNSPWGKVKECQPFGSNPEVFWVSSSSLGGVMMAQNIAHQLKISKYGKSFDDWICFEEDLEEPVAFLALALRNEVEYNRDTLRHALMKIKAWSPDFLDSLNFEDFGSCGKLVSIILEKERETNEQLNNELAMRKRRNQMIQERDPNLITSAVQIHVPTELKKYTRKFQNISEGVPELEQLRMIARECENYQEEPELLFLKGKISLVWTANDEAYLVRDHENKTLELLSDNNVVAKI